MATTFYNKTDGLTYASDTNAQVTKGLLSQARCDLAGANSTTIGYFSGGDLAGTPNIVATTDGLTFSSDTTTQITKGSLTQAINMLSGNNSSTIGYYSGGQNSGGTFMATTNGLTFSSDTTTQITKGSLITGTGYIPGAANSSTIGYFSGGYTNTSYVTTTNGLTFSNDTSTQVTKGALTTATGFFAGCQDVII